MPRRKLLALLALALGVVPFAGANSDPVAAEGGKPVRAHGAEFLLRSDARVAVPATPHDVSNMKLELRIANVTDKALRVNLHHRFKIILTDAKGQEVIASEGVSEHPDGYRPKVIDDGEDEERRQRRGEIESVASQLRRVAIAPGKEHLIGTQTHLRWNPDGKSLQLTWPTDRSGGVVNVNVKPGKYRMRLEYTGEINGAPVPSKVVTNSVAFEIVAK